MPELLSKFTSGELIALVAVAGGLLCGLVAILADHWQKIRQIALKQEMVNRGMSADEIRTVFEAGSKRSRKEGCNRHSSQGVN
jgi:hypothetical protein